MDLFVVLGFGETEKIKKARTLYSQHELPLMNQTQYQISVFWGWKKRLNKRRLFWK